MSEERDEYGTLYRRGGSQVSQKCRRTTSADGRRAYRVEIRGVGGQRDYWRIVPASHKLLRGKIDDAIAIARGNASNPHDNQGG